MKRGFSLVELIIAVGIAAFIGFISLQSIQSSMATLRHVQTQQKRVASLEAFATRLQREAASSDAVWISQDATGNALNFAMLDGSGANRIWTYRFTTKLTRSDTDTPVAIDVPEAQNLTAFTLQSLPVSAIASSQNLLSGLFAQIPVAADAQFSIDTSGVTGNAISVVTLQVGPETRVLHLIANASAESFGIEQGVLWHSVVWRETSTHRFLFGLGQKTYYDIWAEVTYTTDNWKTSHIWCSYDVYGPMDVGDPRAQPTYSDTAEGSKAIFARCQKRTGQRAVPIMTPNPNTRSIE